MDGRIEQTKASTHYDVIVVGGGMAGATFACSLEHSGLSIAVIEAFPPETGKQPSYDDRTIALGYGSWKILHALNIADQIDPANITPIQHIHISERQGFGITRIEHLEENVPALGYVVENRTLGENLWRRLSESDSIDLISPATVVNATNYINRVVVNVAEGKKHRELSTRLLVIADGGRSDTRDKAGFQIHNRSYRQTAIVSNVTPEFAHHNTAWERFIGEGAVALLPMTKHRYSLVWSVANEHADGLMKLSDKSFLNKLHDTYGERCGRFSKVGKRFTYPLAQVRANSPVNGRTALIGNASWSMHPVAGQGFNRGIRDIGALAELVNEAALRGGDPAHPELLKQYAKARLVDDRITTGYTDALVGIFATPSSLLKCVRNLGLASINFAPGIKHSLAELSMGTHARLPRMRTALPPHAEEVSRV